MEGKNMSFLNNKGNKNSHEHSPLKHMFHMVLCCGLPIVIIMLLPLIAGISPAAAGILGVVAPFICPIMMGGMLLMMFRKGKSSCCDETKASSDNTENISMK
jgi:hypothetical protein